MKHLLSIDYDFMEMPNLYLRFTKEIACKYMDVHFMCDMFHTLLEIYALWIFTSILYKFIGYLKSYGKINIGTIVSNNYTVSDDIPDKYTDWHYLVLLIQLNSLVQVARTREYHSVI